MTIASAKWVSWMLLAALVLAARPALARQACSGQWLPGDAVAGIGDAVYASVLWDPDGVGPAVPLVVFGGGFSTAGDVAAKSVAAWNPVTQQWSALGSGITGIVTALITLPNGDLVAGGNFTTAGGVATANVARWNGSSWTPMSTGLDGWVWALTVLPNGEIVAGGWFTKSGSTVLNYVARWNGTNWISMGGGTSGSFGQGFVLSLLTLPNGDVIAGGNFLSAGGVPATRVARWNGVAWSPLGAGQPFEVRALATTPSGDLLAASRTTESGVQRWDGSSWSKFGSGLEGRNVRHLRVLPNGDVLASGEFPTVRRYTNAGWTDIAPATSNGLSSAQIYALLPLPNGNLVIGGVFSRAGDTSARSVALLSASNPVQWASLGSGTNESVLALVTFDDAGLVAGGAFTSIDGVLANYIAQWDGLEWRALGEGTNGPVLAVAKHPDGDLIAAGRFGIAGGVPANSIARWNGASWSAIGTTPGGGTSGQINALLVRQNGDIVVGGMFSHADGQVARGVAVWNGTAWTSLGGSLDSGSVSAILEDPNGDLIVCGTFSSAGGQPVNCVARWSNNAWSSLGTGTNGSVLACARLPDGTIVIGGSFTRAGGLTVNGIARWNGTAWSGLGSGVGGVSGPTVDTLLALPNGDLYAGGNFITAGGSLAQYIARWNGVSWSSLGSGVNNPVSTLLASGGLEVAAGGRFTNAAGAPSANFARWTLTNRPWIVRSPKPLKADVTDTVTLSATPATGYSTVSVQWRRNGTPITNGLAGASPGGGLVSGAAGSLASPTTSEPAVLTITNAQPSDSGDYTAVFSNACGSTTSVAAIVSVVIGACNPADLCGAGATYDNGSVDVPPDGQLTIDDFLVFLTAFTDKTGCPGAGPCNPSDVCGAGATYDNGVVDVPPDGQLTIEDFLVFLNAFNDAAGCPP